MKNFVVAVAVLVCTAPQAFAQTADQVTTYVAVAGTPVGALPPLLTNTLINRLQNGGSLAVRYGNLGRGDFNANMNAFGLTGILPAGLGSSFRLTGGVLLSNNETPLVDDPAGRLMLSVGGDLRLIGSTMGTTATSPLWTVSLDGELGYGNRDPGRFISGYVGAPIALVQRGNGMQFVPFLTPGFAFAQTSVNGSSNSGSMLMVGGGLGIYNTESSVVINVGAQHSFVQGSRTLLGLNVMIGGK
jgi:hypothetical protein